MQFPPTSHFVIVTRGKVFAAGNETRQFSYKCLNEKQIGKCIARDMIYARATGEIKSLKITY